VTDTVDALAGPVPDWAADLRVNLARLHRLSLTDRQFWGTVLATALCVPTPAGRQVATTAAGHLDEPDTSAVGTAVSLMAMNNVFARFCHLTSHESLRPARLGLSVKAMLAPPVDPAHFELWMIAVSAFNGCGRCIDKHVETARGHGVGDELVLDTVRVVSVVHALLVTAHAATVLGDG
jgi:alkyl hydroperoxide reductase subunit D